MSLPSRRRPVILITGASAGIGYELARVIAADGHDVILAARSEDKLRDLAALIENPPGMMFDFVAAGEQHGRVEIPLHGKPGRQLGVRPFRSNGLI